MLRERSKLVWVELDSQDLEEMTVLPRPGVHDAGELMYAVCMLGVVTRLGSELWD